MALQMRVCLIQGPAKLTHRGQGSRLHRAEGDIELIGDLHLCQPFEICHLEHLPLLDGEHLESGPDLLAPLADESLVHNTFRNIFAMNRL